MTFKSGLQIDIIRMGDDCPKNKWLVRNQAGHYGYVPSSSIIIDPVELSRIAREKSTKRKPSEVIDDDIFNDDDGDGVYDETPEDANDPEEIYDEAAGDEEGEDIYEELT